MHGSNAAHGGALLKLHTGSDVFVRPSLGSWVSYGLGTENKNLPGYVILNNDWIPNGGVENFSSAFLPARHGATQLRARGAAVDNIIPAEGLSLQRHKLDLLRAQDKQFAADGDPGKLIDSAIQNYEAAFRLQTSIPNAISSTSGAIPVTVPLVPSPATCPATWVPWLPRLGSLWSWQSSQPQVSSM